MFRLKGKTETNAISNLKDPFRKNCVDSIELKYSKEWFKSTFIWTATIRFTNGSTSGQHRIENCDFNTIVGEVNDLVDSI